MILGFSIESSIFLKEVGSSSPVMAYKNTVLPLQRHCWREAWKGGNEGMTMR